MLENIRGLPGVYTVVSPAAYRAQADPAAENASPHLHHAQDESSGVTVSLSKEALALIRGDTPGGHGQQQSQSGEMDTDAKGTDSGATNNEQLTSEEQRQVEKLKERDREVRAHEQAHAAAAGNAATSGPHFEYETGPDGKRYAIGGEVNISIREGDTPEETIRNAEQARRAALAPADPSAQDRSVAAAASAMANEARRELLEEKMEGVTNAQTSQGTNTTLKEERPAGETAAVNVRGRQELSKQSQLERGYLLGLAVSSMSYQA